LNALKEKWIKSPKFINQTSNLIPQNIFSHVTNNVFNSNDVVKKVQKNDLLSDEEDEPFSLVDNNLNPNKGPNQA
jgi:hypothetical protein